MLRQSEKKGSNNSVLKRQFRFVRGFVVLGTGAKMKKKKCRKGETFVKGLLVMLKMIDHRGYLLQFPEVGTG